MHLFPFGSWALKQKSYSFQWRENHGEELAEKQKEHSIDFSSGNEEMWSVTTHLCFNLGIAI